MVLEVESPLHFCPNCGEKIDLSDSVRLMKWNEEVGRPCRPSNEEPAEPPKQQMPLLDNSLEPPQLRLHTPAVAPMPTVPPPMPPQTLDEPIPMLSQPAVRQRASYRECPFCGAPLREGSDLCEICGGRADGRSSLNTEPIAGPWQRLLARSLDYSLESIAFTVIIFLLVFFLRIVSRQFGVTFLSDDVLSGFLSFMTGFILRTAFLYSPFVFLLDSLEYALFGNTLGKYLFSVKVFDMDGQPLTPLAYFKRNMRVYWGGYGLSFPIVSIFTMYTQYKFVSQGLSTTYDLRLGCTSVSHDESFVKTILGVLLIIVLFFLPFFFKSLW